MAFRACNAAHGLAAAAWMHSALYAAQLYNNACTNNARLTPFFSPPVLLQAERLSKVERWSLLDPADLAAALRQYPEGTGTATPQPPAARCACCVCLFKFCTCIILLCGLSASVATQGPGPPVRLPPGGHALCLPAAHLPRSCPALPRSACSRGGHCSHRPAAGGAAAAEHSQGADSTAC